MMTTPVILDTDIGSDIDDAVALAYLLKQPRCDLLGITTVSGQPELRASLADAICQAAGRKDVAVHVGAEPPMLIPPRQTEASQAVALDSRFPHRKFKQENTAVEFLKDVIHRRPGEIALLTIGPLTNIGLLFAAYPETASMIRHLVMMGGRFSSRSRNGDMREWNILCDPHAAAVVFRAPVPKLTAIGLDVTLQCQLDAEACRRRFHAAGGPLLPVAAFAEVWFKGSSAITFHDPLAAAALFEPNLCTFDRTRVEVDLGSDRTLGLTHLANDGDVSRHEVAAVVDPQAFFKHYFEVVGG